MIKIEVKTPFKKAKYKTLDWSIFLAGGATTKWRDEFIEEFKKQFNENIATKLKKYIKRIVMYSPYCENKHIKLKDLLQWEHDRIVHDSDMMVFNFEGSTSPQPGTIYELGRYVHERESSTIVNCSENYILKRELECHIDALNEDSIGSSVEFHVGMTIPEFVKTTIDKIIELFIDDERKFA